MIIHIVIGPSCAGKSQFVKNVFLKNGFEEKKGLLPYAETADYICIGKWGLTSRVKGLDKISRCEIPKIWLQIEALKNYGKDIVLEGEKCYSGKLFKALCDNGYKIKLYYIRCSIETSIKRNRNLGSDGAASAFKRTATRAKNLYLDWKDSVSEGVEIYDTDDIADFTNFPLDYIKKGEEKDDFAVFILTHGRPHDIPTVKVLRDGGYTGKLYFLLDDEDETADQYRKEYGENRIKVFCKQKYYDMIDEMDITGNKHAILFARHAVFDVASEMGLKNFLMLEDDFTSIEFRYPEGEKLKVKKAKNLDRLFQAYVNWLMASNALTVCMAQGGDMIGGADNPKLKERVLRKAMNSFFCRVDRPIDFRGTMNEDVVTYTTLGSRGKLLFTAVDSSIVQKATQSIKGGMSGTYKDYGTYMKTFYAVMSMPSCVTACVMTDFQNGGKNPRIHHNVEWDCCVPKILNERWKKR